MLTIYQKKHIEEQLKANISSVNLANEGIEDNDVKDIVEIINKNTSIHLYELDLDRNEISDTGFKELLKLKNIDRINLDRNNITLSGLEVLLGMGECSIKHINLSRNALSMSRDDKGKIRQKVNKNELASLLAGYSGPVNIEVSELVERKSPRP